MNISGLQKLTLLDFPEKTACTVFSAGCNFRCPFCHNASLVTHINSDQKITEEEFFEFLNKRKGMLDGVCITGGEPTLQPDLPEFIKKIKDLGFLVKLDTNGYNPKLLSSLLDKGLLDYVAMDIKNSKESYKKTVDITSFDISLIEESVEILKMGRVPFEFRTTVVRQLHTADDILNIGKWLGSDAKYFLQVFKDSGDLIEQGLSGYDEKEMQNLLKMLQNVVPNAKIRG